MFFISIAAVVISSYLIAGIKGAEKKTGNVFFLYFLLTAFAQVVLSFEILSLFKSISKTGFLICSGVFLAAAAVVFLLKKHLQHSAEQPLKQAQRGAFWSAVKRDKALIFLSVCFVLFNILQLITIFAFPVSFGDALAYYLPRCTVWLQNGSIMHYLTPDNRELIMPVNMEFLYTWLLMFTKSESGAAIFSYTGYLGTIYVIFNLLRELNFSIRRSLWAVFVFSSFALVTMQIVTPCADLFIGGLILGSIYLFLRAVKYSDNKALFFSSLAYALAAGTKTTALIMIPSVFIIFCVIIFQHLSNGGGKTEQKEKWKYLFRFCLLFLINFLIFSSYNYILNFIQYQNPFTSAEQQLVHQFRGGVKGYISNVIKYFFALLDMSGMPAFINLNGLIEKLQEYVLNFFGTDINAGASKLFPPVFIFHNSMRLIFSFLGAMGFLVFAPSIVYAAKRAVKKIYHSKNVMLNCEKADGQSARNTLSASFGSCAAIITAALALSFVFNILLFSGVLVFAGYNMRYLLSFAVIAAPVCAYSYPRHKFCKIFLCCIMFLYLIGYAHRMPASYLFECIKSKKIHKFISGNEANLIYYYLLKKEPANAALMASPSIDYSYYILKLRFDGVKIDNILAENIEDFDLTKYEYIIASKTAQKSADTSNYAKRLNNPDKFASECIYTYSKKNNMPIISKCKIPFDYLKSKGFEIDTGFQGREYVILKRK